MRPYTSAADERYRERVARWAGQHLTDLDDDTATDADAIELVRSMGSAGLLKAVVPRAGGNDPASVRVGALAAARETLAHASSLADSMYAMQGLGSYPVTLAGNAATRRRVLPEVARGRSIAAFALTEPEAGSDAGSLQTSAVRDGRLYRLNGEKKFISNAGIADHYVVFARTDPNDRKRGISAFLVEADSPGLTVTERTRLGAPHPIGRIRLEDCPVPASRRLGREGQGLALALKTLDAFRATVGAAACGLARRALDESLARVRSRRQFGRPIGDFQATRLRLAKMSTHLEAARGLVYRAAWTHDSGDRPTLVAAMAKLAATEWAFTIVDDAVQLHGGDGLVHGSVVERLYREVRALRIYEGTSEIQHLVIARELLS